MTNALSPFAMPLTPRTLPGAEANATMRGGI